LSATKGYVFSNDYFYDLRRALDDTTLHLFVVLSPTHQQVVCGGLFTTTDGIVQYHLSGTADAYRKEAPTKLMLHQARCWAKEKNQRLLHFGGGVGAKDNSLFSFKYRFTYLTADYHTYSMVINEEKYEMLVEMWQKKRENTEDIDFFPLYRQPCPDQIER
jgi:lipid II:glycine glycyltransferase (peptidoglycan interpeptide bridge formation enzyme)